MEQLKKAIEQILNQFLQENHQNRLSQHMMMGLGNLIIMELNKFKLEEKNVGNSTDPG